MIQVPEGETSQPQNFLRPLQVLQHLPQSGVQSRRMEAHYTKVIRITPLLRHELRNLIQMIEIRHREVLGRMENSSICREAIAALDRDI